MNKATLLQRVREAGVVGEGGAGFPAHVKYDAQVETVIANGCECEPLLYTDQHIMLRHADEIVAALAEDLATEFSPPVETPGSSPPSTGEPTAEPA